MHLDSKTHFSFIFSIIAILIYLPAFNFPDVFPTNNKSVENTNENSFLVTETTKNFNHIIEENNTSAIYSNQDLPEQKIKIVAAGDFGCRPVAQNNIKQIELQKPDIFLVL